MNEEAVAAVEQLERLGVQVDTAERIVTALRHALVRPNLLKYGRVQIVEDFARGLGQIPSSSHS